MKKRRAVAAIARMKATKVNSDSHRRVGFRKKIIATIAVKMKSGTETLQDERK